METTVGEDVQKLKARATDELKGLIRWKGLCVLDILGGFALPQQTGLMADPPNMTCSLSPSNIGVSISVATSVIV